MALESRPHHLISSAEELVDTWGRGYFEFTKEGLASIRTSGGILRA
jgi:hypothetical protein